MSSDRRVVRTFEAVPRKRTGETITVLVTLAVLFLLLFVMIGHPSVPHPADRPHGIVPHAASGPH